MATAVDQKMTFRCRLFKFRKHWRKGATAEERHTELWDTVEEPFDGKMPDAKLVATVTGKNRVKVFRRITAKRAKLGIGRVGSWGCRAFP